VYRTAAGFPGTGSLKIAKFNRITLEKSSTKISVIASLRSLGNCEVTSETLIFVLNFVVLQVFEIHI